MKKHAAASRKPVRGKSIAGVRRNKDLDFDLDLLHPPQDEDDDDDLGIENLIEELLLANPDGPDDMPDPATMSLVTAALDGLRVAANGGDPDARRTLATIRSAIDRAARRRDIHPIILVMLGRLLAGANIEIGDALPAALESWTARGLFQAPGEPSYRAVVKPALASGFDNPFDLFEELRALTAIFPIAYSTGFAELLGAEAKPLARHASLGFLLHPDERLALAAARGLAAAEAKGLMDRDCRRRIKIVRQWVAPARRAALEAALPPSPSIPARAAVEIAQAWGSVCDGSGASLVSAMIRRGGRYAVALVMSKPSGIADCAVLDRLSAEEARDVGGATSAPTVKISLPGFARLVALGLGRNLETGAPPPFGLLQALEAVGLDAIVPEAATPAEIIEKALAEFPDRDEAGALGLAHERVLQQSYVESWFEAGEDVESVLGKASSIEEGAKALLEGYLDGRRSFWARQCALSALTLKDSSPPLDQTWADLALVGRDILRDSPSSEIPLMRQIAEKSAEAFYLRP